MDLNNQYYNLSELAQMLAEGIDKLSEGKLNQIEIETLLANSRELHERLAVIRYLSIKEEIKEPAITSPVPQPANEPIQEKGSFKLNFDFPAVEDIESNQINLLDAIAQQAKDPADKSTINDKFSNQPETLAQRMSRQPISDLIAAIGLNQKFLFINDLFGGSNDKYREAVNKLNAMNDYQEASDFMETSLMTIHKWSNEHPSVKKFVDLIERRYM